MPGPRLFERVATPTVGYFPARGPRYAPINADFRLPRPPPRLYGARFWAAHRGPAPRSSALAAYAPTPCARSRTTRQPGRDSGPAGTREVRPAARHVALLDVVLRRAGGRAARRARGRPGRGHGHLAGRQHDARGGLPGARAAARH